MWRLMLSMLSPSSTWVLLESSSPFSSASFELLLLVLLVMTLSPLASISKLISASHSSCWPSSELSPAKTRGEEVSLRSPRGASPRATRRRGRRPSRVTVSSSLSAVMDDTPWYSRRLRAANLYRALDVPNWCCCCAGLLRTASAMGKPLLLLSKLLLVVLSLSLLLFIMFLREGGGGALVVFVGGTVRTSFRRSGILTKIGNLRTALGIPLLECSLESSRLFQKILYRITRVRNPQSAERCSHSLADNQGPTLTATPHPFTKHDEQQRQHDERHLRQQRQQLPHCGSCSEHACTAAAAAAAARNVERSVQDGSPQPSRVPRRAVHDSAQSREDRGDSGPSSSAPRGAGVSTAGASERHLFSSGLDW